MANSSIEGRQRFVTTQFSTFYDNHGYIFSKPSELIPEDDKTVLFTCATITPLRKLLEKPFLVPGYYVIQKCLRVQNLETIYDKNNIPEYMSHFTMCGTLASPNRGQEVAQEAHQYLTKNLGVESDNLLLLASSADSDISAPLRGRVTILEDSKPDGYYRWKYGVDGIHGRGVTFAVRSNVTDRFRDIGNIVIIENNGNSGLAYEFGFGVETILSRIDGLKRPIAASLISEVHPYEEGSPEKLMDTLVAVVALYHNGIYSGRGKEHHVSKMEIKALSYWRRKLGYTEEKIRELCQDYELKEFGDAKNTSGLIITDVLAYESTRQKFIDYAANQVHAHKLRGQINQRLTDKLKREGVNMGIIPCELDEIVEMVLK